MKTGAAKASFMTEIKRFGARIKDIKGFIMQELTLLGHNPLTFGLSGEIDSQNADEFYSEIIEKYTAAPCDVVFDCAQLAFIDSTTLGTFVKILKHVKTDGHSMKLCRLQPRLRKLFVICALDTIMEIEP